MSTVPFDVFERELLGAKARLLKLIELAEHPDRVQWQDALERLRNARETLTRIDLAIASQRAQQEPVRPRTLDQLVAAEEAQKLAAARIVTKPQRSTEERKRLAKRWAKAHGYTGREGGWIYRPSGTPIVQGYANLYSKRWELIERWVADSQQ